MSDIIQFPSDGEAAEFIKRLQEGPAEIRHGKYDGAVLITPEHRMRNLTKYEERDDLLCVVVKMGSAGLKDCTGVIIHNKVEASFDVSRQGSDTNDLMSEAEKTVYLDELERRFHSLKRRCKKLKDIIKRLRLQDAWASEEALCIDRSLRLSPFEVRQ